MRIAKPTTLDEITTKIVMGPFGSKIKTENFVQAGTPVIRGGNLTDSKFKDDGLVFVDDTKAEELKSAWAFPLDIVITHRGTLGQAAIIPTTAKYKKYIVSQSQMKLSIDPSKADPYFVYYFLNSPIGQQRLLANTSQVGVPAIAQPTSSIKAIEIELPETIEDQIEITKVLRSLDYKIELNHGVSKTLEAIAQALFQSWFVDFDPVRAKASGEAADAICQRLGLTPELLVLFPDRLVDSELGEIPEGWEAKPLDQVATYLNGLALQKFRPTSETIWLPVIKIAQLKSGSVIGADRASHELKPEYIVDDGDVLFSWSGSLEVDLWCNGRGALNQHLFKVTSDQYPKWFYFLWTKHHLASFRAIAAGKAVTMGHIQRKHLTEALCAVPSEAIIEAASTLFGAMLLDQIETRKQSRELSSIRDALLPKLLSGEIQVSKEDLP